MTIAILRIDKRVIIDKVFVACIVWRIYVDYINPALVSITKGCECLKVISLNQNMIGGIRIIT